MEAVCPWCEKPIYDGEQIKRVPDAGGTFHEFHPVCWDAHTAWMDQRNSKK